MARAGAGQGRQAWPPSCEIQLVPHKQTQARGWSWVSLGMAAGQGLSFTFRPAQMGSDRAGGCLKFKEDMWLWGRSSAEKLFPAPSAGKNMFKLFPPPGILSFPSPFSHPSHYIAGGGANGIHWARLWPLLLQEVYPEHSCSHSALYSLHSNFNEWILIRCQALCQALAMLRWMKPSQGWAGETDKTRCQYMKS